jgi:hypothetical protein
MNKQIKNKIKNMSKTDIERLKKKPNTIVCDGNKKTKLNWNPIVLEETVNFIRQKYKELKKKYKNYKNSDNNIDGKIRKMIIFKYPKSNNMYRQFPTMFNTITSSKISDDQFEGIKKMIMIAYLNNKGAISEELCKDYAQNIAFQYSKK